MTERDHRKLTQAGFTIIRPRDTYPVSGPPLRLDIFEDIPLESSGPGYEIWAKSNLNLSWYKYTGPFPSKAARQQAMEKLLESDRIIED